jgi:hypothetical protein
MGFQFVGNCYVHGFACGEGMDLALKDENIFMAKLGA